MGPVGTLGICEGLVLVVGKTEGDGQAHPQPQGTREIAEFWFP